MDRHFWKTWGEREYSKCAEAGGRKVYSIIRNILWLSVLYWQAITFYSTSRCCWYRRKFLMCWQINNLLTTWLTNYPTNSMERSLSWEANSFSSSQEIPAFYGTWSFITATTPLPIRATCIAHLILLDFITPIIFGEQYISLSSSLYSSLHFPVTPFHWGPNILLSTLFSNTLILRSSLNVSDQFKHP
jgi:hypothetical protein